jgi:hypothetical protein
MIVAVLEAAQDRLDPPRANLGARDIHRTAIVQRWIRSLHPCLREGAIAEHLLGVVRDAREGEWLPFLKHTQFYHSNDGSVMVFTASRGSN